MPKPLKELLACAEMDDIGTDTTLEMARRLRALDGLHQRDVVRCQECGEAWPCDSRRALDGEE
jgi:hypothetical protein